jgi:hypothetical protein
MIMIIFVIINIMIIINDLSFIFSLSNVSP